MLFLVKYHSHSTTNVIKLEIFSCPPLVKSLELLTFRLNITNSFWLFKYYHYFSEKWALIKINIYLANRKTEIDKQKNKISTENIAHKHLEKIKS